MWASFKLLTPTAPILLITQRANAKKTACHAPKTSCSTNYAREKLVGILNGDIPVPKQRWCMSKILATLTYHQKDPRLHLPYRQFKHFSYQTLLEESEPGSEQFPKALSRKDWNIIIELRAKAELEKRYVRKSNSYAEHQALGL